MKQLLCLIVLLLASSLFSETIITKDNRRVEGSLIYYTRGLQNNYLILQVSGENITIYQSEISQVIRSDQEKSRPIETDASKQIPPTRKENEPLILPGSWLGENGFDLSGGNNAAGLKQPISKIRRMQDKANNRTLSYEFEFKWHYLLNFKDNSYDIFFVDEPENSLPIHAKSLFSFWAKFNFNRFFGMHMHDSFMTSGDVYKKGVSPKEGNRATFNQFLIGFHSDIINGYKALGADGLPKKKLNLTLGLGYSVYTESATSFVELAVLKDREIEGFYLYHGPYFLIGMEVPAGRYVSFNLNYRPSWNFSVDLDSEETIYNNALYDLFLSDAVDPAALDDITKEHTTMVFNNVLEFDIVFMPFKRFQNWEIKLSSIMYHRYINPTLGAKNELIKAAKDKIVDRFSEVFWGVGLGTSIKFGSFYKHNQRKRKK